MLIGAFVALVTALCLGIWGLHQHGRELQYSAAVAGLWTVAAMLTAGWMHGL